jgi:hypothetical protein
MTKKLKGVRMDEHLIEKIEKKGNEEHRTFSSMVIVLLNKALGIK